MTPSRRRRTGAISCTRSRRPWSRREVLQTGLKGGAAAMAAAYGLRPDYALAQVPNEFDGTKFQLRAPEPNPKRGGVLRYGITCRPPHFDVHQSGTINNLGSQGCMFDNLVRRDPRAFARGIAHGMPDVHELPDFHDAQEEQQENRAHNGKFDARGTLAGPCRAARMSGAFGEL